jgi:protein-disulfide isomerase/uncharacterized membrane protein
MPIPSNQTSAVAAPSPRTAAPPALTGVGALLLAAAAASSGMLALQRVGGISLPGCGGGSACDQAAKSVWGSVPGLLWPISYVGTAFFLGMLAAWLAARGQPGPALRWLARLGVLASLMYIGVMLSKSMVCQYCLFAHIANIAFWIVLEIAGRRHPESTPASAIPVFALAFFAASAALGMAEVRSNELSDRAAAASIARMQETIKPSPVPPTPAATGATGTVPAAAGSTGSTGTATARQTPAAHPVTVPTPAGFTGRYRAGPANAGIRIVMITDYQCPDCKQFEAQARRALSNHPNVSLSVKHFPFCTDCNSTPNVPNLHPNACWAARAAEAVGMLHGNEGFWAMHHWLFERAGAFDAPALRQGLQSFGFDADKVIAAMSGPETLALVQADIREAIGLGLRRTPMIFVNGVELMGWGTDALALHNAVEAMAKLSPPPGDPTMDRPPTAQQRLANEASEIIDRWRDTLKTPAMAWPVRAQPWTIIPVTAPITVTLWGDFLEPNCAEADRIIRDAIAGRSDIRYEFRYFPFDQACNPTLPRTIIPNGCRAVRAAEAAGQMGGIDTYWRMHVWLMENQKSFNDAALRAAAAGMGLDAEAFMKRLDAPEISEIIGKETNIGARLHIEEIPRVFVNGKVITRPLLEGQFIIERVIAEAEKAAQKK